MIDELPVMFSGLALRRMLWRDYGYQLPGFGPDEIMDAIVLSGIENKRAEHDRRAAEQEAERQRRSNGR